MNTDLVRPGDITDAADSTDLLRALEVVNLPKIDDKLATRSRTELRMKREKEIFEQYEAKANAYYAGIWKRCEESAVSHSYISMDIGHTTISVCQTCSFPRGAQSGTDGYGKPKFNDDDANEYKQTQIRNLAKQMRDLDMEAGILDWPKDDDFIGLEVTLGQKKKRGIFR